jgi:hypothetical protein
VAKSSRWWWIRGNYKEPLAKIAKDARVFKTKQSLREKISRDKKREGT